MSSNGWKKYKLGDALETLIDYRGKTPTKTQTGVPLITAKIVKDGFIHEPTEFISASDYDSWMTRGFPKVGDVVLTTEAPLGEVGRIKDVNVALAQRIVTLRGKKGILDSSFLKYYLQSDIGKQKLRERETGTTVTGIKQSELRKIEIECPPYEQQVKIASILSSLDDKIELNRQTNATLEAIAQALFKEWFVDFNYPGATGEMVESELGMIPRGWRTGSILEIGKLLGGGTPKTSVEEYWNGDIDWISAKDVSANNRSFIIQTEKRITDAGLNNSSAKLIPEFATVITARGTVGNYSLLPKPMTISQSNYALKAQNGFGDYFLYFSVQNSVNAMQRMSYGTIFDTITTETLRNLKVIVPSENVAALFEKEARGLFEAILNAIQQNHTLAHLRDILLPKLIKQGTNN